jgi:hypothetical protein
MPTERRRARSDSLSASVAAFGRANQQPAWPATVSRLPRPADADRAETVFEGIVSQRDPQDWRPNDLALAAQLANCMSQADRVSQEIEREGWTIPSPKNPDYQLRNPKLDALTLISSRQLSLTRALALNGSPSGDRRTTNNRARLITDTRALDDAADSVSLLA